MLDNFFNNIDHGIDINILDSQNKFICEILIYHILKRIKKF